MKGRRDGILSAYNNELLITLALQHLMYLHRGSEWKKEQTQISYVSIK